jgi:hypothetical protein
MDIPFIRDCHRISGSSPEKLRFQIVVSISIVRKNRYSQGLALGQSAMKPSTKAHRRKLRLCIPRILVQKSGSASRERSHQVLGSPGALQMPARLMSSYWLYLLLSLLDCPSGLLRNWASSRSASCPMLPVDIAGGNAGANRGLPWQPPREGWHGLGPGEPGSHSTML